MKALPHPGCTCHHCEVARAATALKEREIRELREKLRNLGEQVALLNQQVVGLLRERNERREEPMELHPSSDGLRMAGPREE